MTLDSRASGRSHHMQDCVLFVGRLFHNGKHNGTTETYLRMVYQKASLLEECREDVFVGKHLDEYAPIIRKAKTQYNLQSLIVEILKGQNNLNPTFSDTYSEQSLVLFLFLFFTCGFHAGLVYSM